MCAIYVELLCAVRFRLGWAHDIFKYGCHLFMHTYLQLSLYWYWYCWFFSVCFFLSLFLLLAALRHLNENPLCPRILFVLRDLLLQTPLLLTYGSIMIKPVRTFRRISHDEVFIWNAKSFYWIFPILTFPLSSIVGVGSHCVTSRSLVPPWSYRSFTPICMDLTILYLILSLAFEVRAL